MQSIFPPLYEAVFQNLTESYLTILDSLYIDEDICPQREGFDSECDRRCAQLYPMRISSGCRTRSSGTLLSFFGIRSFVCTCHLANIACANIQFAMHPFHMAVVQQHSYLTSLANGEQTCDQRLTCRDNFQPPNCNWRLSKEFEWFSAQPNGGPMPGEAPVGLYLAGSSQSGATWATVSTCDGLCSKTSVNLTARIWRPPTVVVELCFKEKETTLCAPVQSSNGRLLNEVIPETPYYQVMLRFSNVSAGEMVLLDDLSVSYQPCDLSQPSSVQSSGTSQVAPVRLTHRSREGILPKRICQNGDCVHSASHVADPYPAPNIAHSQKMCVGRAGLAICRQKCKSLDTSDSAARCIRQRDNPLVKKCICQVRRSPIRKIDGGSRISDDVKSDEQLSQNRILADDSIMKSDPMGAVLNSSTWCNLMERDICTQKCGAENPESSGVCHTPQNCECRMKTTCSVNTCNFEKGTKCGWADLRMLSQHFNNISVAMKKGDENRYGISRLKSSSYSGLLYKANLIGPISMSVDVFPSHVIDVRICVQNLRKCQSQTIAARSWNRISAKIKVPSTEKIFVLFYNSEKTPKSIAIDNIIIRNGTCV
ncbi:unnamed protein product [Caenorhabditis bovis]|uniref:MAM domain-containing protein n=1 Tax=Caenorhabditis bovis TaxID=2654633 RepID=A0A8S1F3F8_9PELO|nr:unnamed protein product [Caenorhabditis bovis]